MIINVILDSFISREMCFSLLRRDLFPARINDRGTSQLHKLIPVSLHSIAVIYASNIEQISPRES